ncbi:hypothetical protein H6G80_19680 [Nostoc sp. FACHB-87]|uniref:hypothetical protein n=1 Tax=Nostocales TaxID=1161 RepID=UPI0016828491|nr:MULTISPECIES: hypothetical protein [Nostocales]MBD2301376.1 hypothetical protein [Nostoc sp. FACHB-190]MBD2456285.1 hypothetical protein [Nostoc sp. FACHB-87]MBD2477706.1 hypothetical protein [Anabaena sp. FACHB-83]MBD2486736.1 hypothetical protein [Aulosira sp. FACHB-615]
MLIKNIEILSEDAEEALLHITDGVYECAAFCQPCNKCIGYFIEEPLLSFNSQYPVLETINKTPYISRKKSGFAHEILGQVISVEENLVRVGNIIIELDVNLPGDININDLVKFTCARLDT